MKLLNIADTDLQSVVDEVTRTGGELFVGRNGTPVAKIVSLQPPPRSPEPTVLMVGSTLRIISSTQLCLRT